MSWVSVKNCLNIILSQKAFNEIISQDVLQFSMEPFDCTKNIEVNNARPLLSCCYPTREWTFHVLMMNSQSTSMQPLHFLCSCNTTFSIQGHQQLFEARQRFLLKPQSMLPMWQPLHQAYTKQPALGLCRPAVSPSC